MILREQSIIDRPPDAVWPYLVTPELFQKWNDKVESMNARERFRKGQTFTTHYLWKGKPMQCTTTVTELEEGRLIELRHAHMVGTSSPREMEAVERIELKPRGKGSVVTKTVDIMNSGVPWWLAPLIWLINRFGTRQGEDKLKTLCESDERS